MNRNIYEDTDIDVDNNSDIEGFEIAYSSTNKKAIRKTKTNKYHIRQKLDSINEKRSLARQLDSFSDYWNF
jgi:hypothetical protein